MNLNPKSPRFRVENPDYVPPLEANDVRLECQRRILVAVGASDWNDCMAKENNANMLANQLNDKHVEYLRARLDGRDAIDLTDAERAQVTGLRNLAAAIQSLRRCCAALIAATEIPADYRDDKHWTG